MTRKSTLKPGKYSIPVVTRLQDNGDGGWTIFAYNDIEELLADHPEADEMTDELREEILTENDPYKNGYIGKDTIEIEVTADGNIRLAKGILFHAGQ